MLLAQIENRVPPGQKEVIPTEIVVRDSVRAIAGAL